MVAFSSCQSQGSATTIFVLLDPGAVFHAPGNAAESLLAVLTAELDVVATEVLGDDSEYLIVVGHTEVPSPGVFCHNLSTWGRRLNGCRVTVS